jgi:hypothetical protein
VRNKDPYKPQHPDIWTWFVCGDFWGAGNDRYEDLDSCYYMPNPHMRHRPKNQADYEKNFERYSSEVRALPPTAPLDADWITDVTEKTCENDRWFLGREGKDRIRFDKYNGLRGCKQIETDPPTLMILEAKLAVAYDGMDEKHGRTEQWWWRSRTSCAFDAADDPWWRDEWWNN